MPRLLQVHYKTANCSGGDLLGVWDSAILSIECLPQNESFSLRGGILLRVRGSPHGMDRTKCTELVAPIRTARGWETPCP